MCCVMSMYLFQCCCVRVCHRGFVLVSGCFSMCLGIAVQAGLCVSVGLCFNASGNRSLTKVVCQYWVVFQCCWESQFKQVLC